MANPIKKLQDMFKIHNTLKEQTHHISSVIEIFKYIMSNEFYCYMLRDATSEKAIAFCNTAISKSTHFKEELSSIIGDDSEELSLLCDEVNTFYSNKLVELHNM